MKTLLDIKKIQIKPTIKYQFTSIRIALKKGNTNINCW